MKHDRLHISKKQRQVVHVQIELSCAPLEDRSYFLLPVVKLTLRCVSYLGTMSNAKWTVVDWEGENSCSVVPRNDITEQNYSENQIVTVVVRRKGQAGLYKGVALFISGKSRFHCIHF